MMALPARPRPIPSHLLDETAGQPFEVDACPDACLGAPRATVAEAPPGVDLDALHVLAMARCRPPRAYPSASGPRSALGWRNPSNAPVTGREERGAVTGCVDRGPGCRRGRVERRPTCPAYGDTGTQAT